ncbi:MAG: winged helix-turn-helix domain-containing protein [Opitutales bacterium]|nr:winged helix-turn-helix domain-containing protein [Opitutales bacterium]
METSSTAQFTKSPTAPIVAQPAVVFSPLDPRRFNYLSEAEVLQRIGALLAEALVRSGCLLQKPAARPRLFAPVGPLVLIRDPVEQLLARFLQQAGPTAPRDLATALGLNRSSVATKLKRLCACGHCEVVGKTRAARYRIRTDHDRN